MVSSYPDMVHSAHREILDTTLREGEQCYGVFFPIDVKKRIASLLDGIGVDFIEVGHPAAAPSIREAVSEIVKLDLRPRLAAHARLDKNEIRLVKELGVQWVSLFCGINERSRRRYGLSKQELFKKAGDVVAYAKALGLSVKFGCEDASRTGARDLEEFYSFLTSLGVERLSYADTLGALRPQDIVKLYSLINDQLPFSRLNLHLHNDFGFAFKNAVKAIEYGCRCIDVSVSGIGERMGLVPLEQVLAYLCRKGRRPYKVELVQELIDVVARCINQDRFRKRRFAHKSGIHIHGVVKDSTNYELFDPRETGRDRLFVLSKLIGKTGLQMLLSNYGFRSDELGLRSLLEQIKANDSLELAEPEEIQNYFLEQGLEKQHA